MDNSETNSRILLTSISSNGIQNSDGSLIKEKKKSSIWNKVAKRVRFKRLSSLPNQTQSKKRRIGVAGPAVKTISDTFLEPSCNETANGSNPIKQNGGNIERENDIDHENENINITSLNQFSSQLKQPNPITNGNTNHLPVGVKVNGFIDDRSKKIKKTQDTQSQVSHSNKAFKFLSSLKRPAAHSSSSQEKNNKHKPQYNLHNKDIPAKFAHLGLLAPAIIIHPSIHGEDTLTKKISHKFGNDLQLKLAAAHIKDAINGRGKFGEAKAIFKPPYIQRCFNVISSSWWHYLLYGIIALHCLMMLWEQPTRPVAVGKQWHSWDVNPALFLVLDAVVLFVYIVDVVLHCLFLTWKNVWFAKEMVWIRVEFVFTLFFIIDYIILVVEVAVNKRLVCPFRCLRSSMLLCKSKNVAHIFNVLLSIISKLGKVFLIIGIFILTFASIGLHLFMMDYHNLNETSANSTDNSTSLSIYDGAFDQVASATLHMFVLMSTENYPEFIIPAFNETWVNFFYFGLYLYAGVFFLTAILLAIIVESYWDYSKRHVKQERRQQREELAKAWNLMDPLGKGQLSAEDDELLKLFKLLKPKNTDDENLELIHYISMYGDGVIDSYDWTTKLVEALSFEFEEEPNQESGQDNNCNNVVFDGLQKVCRYVMHTKAVSVAILVLICVHSVLFCIMWVGIPDEVQLGIHSAKTAIVAVFVVEILMRVVADGKELLNVFDTLDMAMVVFAVVGNIVWYVLWFRNPRPRALYLGACVVTSGGSVLMRAVFNSKHARAAVLVLRNIYPVMFDLLLLVMTIIFNFAVVGLEIFQDKTLDNSQAQGYEGSYVEYKCGVGFETFGCSLLIVFQIVTTNDWHEIMLGAMLDAGWPSAFYFVACYLIIDMIVMNLFVAISIEAYKKLAIDNTNFVNSDDGNSRETEDDDSPIPPEREDTSFAANARNTFSQIFAPSRKARGSIGSSTLTGYSTSPYAVRRGTLGSLGQVTPTPTPRGDESRRTSVASSVSRPVVKVQDTEAAGAKAEEQTNKVKENQPQRNVDRRHRALKERTNQRKKERRRTKQEEEAKVANELNAKEQLQMDDVVRLKRMVRVIKSFSARSSLEMNLTKGDFVQVSQKADNMLRGPEGWFPATYVAEDAEKSPGGEAASSESQPLPSHPHVVVTTEQAEKKPRVQFDESIPEPSTKKPRQPSPRHRISQVARMKRRSDGADWRREIHGDITVMNKDEMHDLSKMIRGGLERRHTHHLRSVPTQLAIRPNEELLEADEEEELSVPQLTVSEAKPEPVIVQEESSPTIVSDTNTLTLSVPQSRTPRRLTRKKSKPPGDGSIPDWMQKFVDEKKISVVKDVKLEDSFTSVASSEEEREAAPSNPVAPKRRSIKRKDATPPVFRRRPSPGIRRKKPSP